jgi:hypothetical protein
VLGDPEDSPIYGEKLYFLSQPHRIVEWVPEVECFAKTWGIPPYYRDNSWVEIMVSRVLLQAFLFSVFGEEYEKLPCVAAIPAASRYRLTGEEF